MKPLIITIDGPAGTGKSTAAQLLASHLRIPFLDTGAMYRAVAWRCLKNGIAFDNEKQAALQAKKTRFEFAENRLLIDGEEPHDELRTQEVSQTASVIATLQAVRDVLVDQQRKLAGTYSLVTEGRDQGTVVFPDATCKFFLTASAEIRAQRRWIDLQKNAPATLNARATSKKTILNEIKQRDTRDRNRKVAPLKPASDAIVIDNSEKSLEEVAKLLIEHVQQATTSSN